MGVLIAVCAALAGASGAFPVIGIMAHPTSSNVSSCGGSCEYVAASYVKFVELAGARAVPISYYSTDAEIDDLMSQINGILLPGGSVSLPASAQRVVANARKISAGGGHFPVYGVCLGFEWIVEAVGGKGILTSGLDAENISLSLNLTVEGKNSRIYEDAAARKILATNPVTMNNHHQGLSPEEYSKNRALHNTFKLLSTNVDRRGREFVSSIEGYDAPIYGTQYHPEKNIFEWGTYANGRPYEVIQHTPEAVKVTQSLANFFVKEARKNGHVYDLSSNRRFFESYATDGDKAPVFVEAYHLFPCGTSSVV